MAPLGFGSIRTEHNLNGKMVSEDELRQATYALNQQRECKAAKPTGAGIQPLPGSTTKPSERDFARTKEQPAEPKVDDESTEKLLKANKSDLKKRNL